MVVVITTIHFLKKQRTMSAFSIDTIKADVRNVLAENEDIQSLLADDGILDDQLVAERDTLIESLICKAVDRVHVAAPYNFVRGVEVLNTNSWNDLDEYSKRINLPNDFLRLGFVRLGNWRVPVYTAIDADKEEYTQARSPFSIMRPNPRHPLVAIVKTEDGLTLEAYPKCKDGTNSCYYVQKSKISDESKEVSIADDCYYAAIYMIANLYYVSINEPDKAKAMAEEVAEILNGKELFKQ